MKEEYWHKKWQANEIGFNQAKPGALIQQYLPSLDLKTGARIFVPLCGKSVDMLWLADQGFDVVGVEISTIACESFFAENDIDAHVSEAGNFTVFKSPKITLFAGDFFNLNKSLIGKIDAVYDRAALIALPDELRQRYSSHLIELLAPGAKMLLITMSYNQDEMQGPPFSVDQNEVTRLYAPYFDVKQLHSENITEISDHLRSKGLTSSTDYVYCLVSNNSF